MSIRKNRADMPGAKGKLKAVGEWAEELGIDLIALTRGGMGPEQRQAVLETVQALAFRRPMPVTQALLFRSGDAYPICPRCALSMEREFQRCCDRCGQCLDWRGYKWAQIISPQD